MHEWLLAIHQTVDEFKTKQVGTSVATQTAESSLETNGKAEGSTQKGREESSSPSGPASSDSSVDDSVQNEHFDGPTSQSGHAAHEVQTVHLSMKGWGSTEMLRKEEEEEEEEEQGRERGSTQIKRRSILSGQGKRSSRHISPPRDPPPPPPNDVVDPPEPSSESDLPSNDVNEAMNQTFGQMDGKVSVPRQRRRPRSAVHLGTSMEDIGEHFSTFKPDSLSQPNDTASAFRKNPNLPSLGRRWKVIGEGTTAKIKPIETPIPQVPHTYQEAQTEEAADPVAVSVYSDDFVEHHHSLKRSHRRKMSAPANLLLDEPMDTDPLPYPPMRQQRSYGDLHSILPKPLDLAPPLPPRTPTNLKPEVNIAESEEAAMPNIRQSSLRKMVSKDFLSHLTSVIPLHHQKQQQKKESEGKQESSTRENGRRAPPVKDVDVEEHPAAGKNSYEPVVDKEMTKVSINEIKKRLFGDRSNLVTSPISHSKPTIQAQSPVADTPVRPPEPSKTRLQSEDSEVDEPHTPIPYTREVPTPSIARNPNYGEQSQNRGRGNPRSDLRPQSAILGQSWQNGYAPRASRDHTPPQPYDRNAWVSSSQSINDFRFHDVTHLHRGIRPIPRLQQDHRATSSSVLQRMSQLKGRITSLDSNFVATNLPQKVGRYRGSSPRTESQARYSPKASPPGEETSRAPKQMWPYIRGSGQNRRPNTRSQSQPAERDTPSRMALSVFDTMVEWDEKSNTTILRSTC